MKRNLNDHLLPLVFVDSGTLLLLSFYIYLGKKVISPFIVLLCINHVITSIILLSNKKTIYVHHLLGKPKVDFVYEYMKKHAFFMSVGIILFMIFIFITQISIDRQILTLIECCLILLLSNSLVYVLFLRKCL